VTEQHPPENIDNLLDDTHPSVSSRMATLALIPSAVAFNIALAGIVLFLKLPVYLDCVGIITTTLIAGLVPGLIVTILAFAMMALLFNHIIIFYTGTAVAMAVITHLSAMIGGFKTMLRTVISGLVLGIVSALVSLPVTVYIFGGVTTAGATFLTAWFIHRGFSMKVAVFMTNMICDASTDKIAEVLIAVWLVRSVPADLLVKFRGPTLAENFKLHTTVPVGFDAITPNESRKPT
jgi:energy-coupling factor transport system substrate-specific component